MSEEDDDLFEITMPVGGGKKPSEKASTETPSDRARPEAASDASADTQPPSAPPSKDPVTQPLPVAGADHYTVGREIAKGGMGRILEAEDQGLGRTVAMKVMIEGDDSSSEAQRRFTREAEVLARLEHPNIVPIHELGRDGEGRAFYTMKLVKGRTLQAIIDDLRKSDAATLRDYHLDRLLSVFRKICDAIAFAHFHHIIHRDLKPDNIMVGEFGEVLVMDWGLAKILTDPDDENRESTGDDLPAVASDSPIVDDLTMDGEFIGTPRYMPPEQAGGLVEEVDERSDIFALGGILYAILTLCPPVRGNSLKELLDNLKTGNIAAPSSYGTATRSGTAVADDFRSLPDDVAGLPLPHCPGGKVPGAISAVAMRALAVEKSDRYQSVDELADDIDRYQGGFATSVESLGAVGQALLFVKRHRAVSLAVMGSLMLITVLTSVFISKLMASNRQTELKADEALQNAARAESNAARAMENAARAKDNSARANAVSDFLTGMFEDADPVARHGRSMGARGRVGPDLTAKEIMGYSIKSLEGSLTNSPIVRAGVLDKIGNVCLSLGLYDEAAPLIKESLDIRIAEYGEDHADVAASLRAMGMSHFYRGENDRAEAALKRSLRVVEELHGADHPLVSNIALDLGVVSFVNHDDTVAQGLMARSLAIRQQHHGRNSREALAALLFLTVLENTGGRTNPERVEELAEVWDSSEGGGEFGEFINLFLEGNLTVQLDKRAGEEMFAKAEELGIRLLGAEHLIISMFRSRHAEVLSVLGRKEDAKEMLAEAIANVSKSLGEDFILNGQLAMVLGAAAASSGDQPAAAAAYRRAAEVYGRQLTVNADEMYLKEHRKSLQRLSSVLIKQGKYVEADQALAPLVERYDENLEDYPEIAQRYALLNLHAEKPELLPRDLSSRAILRGKNPAFVGAVRYGKALNSMRQHYDRPAVARVLEAQALKFLDYAVSKGYRNLDNLRTNVAFDGLRANPEFQKTIGKITER